MNRIETELVHPPSSVDPTGAASVPIYQTATFDLAAGGRFDYSRSGNPTREVLEAQLARLDAASRALAYPSGVTAIDAVLSLLRPGEEILVADDLYGGTVRLLRSLADRLEVTVTPFDMTDPSSLRTRVTSRTRGVLGARSSLG